MAVIFLMQEMQKMDMVQARRRGPQDRFFGPFAEKQHVTSQVDRFEDRNLFITLRPFRHKKTKLTRLDNAEWQLAQRWRSGEMAFAELIDHGFILTGHFGYHYFPGCHDLFERQVGMSQSKQVPAGM